jgi:hypothetical protein
VKARRIYGYLERAFWLDRKIDFQQLAGEVYRERLLDIPKQVWKPRYGFLLNKKPSAFAKNFIEYLIKRLKEDGFAQVMYVVEANDLALSTDKFEEVEGLINELKKELEELGIEKPEIHIKREARLSAIPTFDYLLDLCVWKDPFSE